MRPETGLRLLANAKDNGMRIKQDTLQWWAIVTIAVIMASLIGMAGTEEPGRDLYDGIRSGQ
jgi:hypothetical protein